MSPMPMSKVESAMRAALEIEGACGRGDAAAILANVADDCVFESPDPPPAGSVLRGKGEIEAYWRVFFAGRPGFRMEVEEAAGLGMRCVVRWKREWKGPGGETLLTRGMDSFLVKGGLVSEWYSYVKGS